MARPSPSAYAASGLLAAAWVVTGLLASASLSGFISTSGIFAVVNQCPPRWTGLHDLCTPVHVRVELPQHVPPRSADVGDADAELSGPLEATLSLQQPNWRQRVAYNASPSLTWLTAFGFLAPFVWRLRPSRLGTLGHSRARTIRDRDAPDPEQAAVTTSDLAPLVMFGGAVVAVGGTAAVLTQHWGVGLLASTAGAGYPPAEAWPLGLALVPILVGTGLITLGRLHRVVRRQGEDLRGLV